MGAVEERVVAHVTSTRYEDLPATAVEKVRTFLLDTIGVGIAGSCGANIDALRALAQAWGNQPEASVFTEPGKISAQSAAMVNAYQIHCLEYDCVHEGAVLHPMATILSALMAWVEREKGQGRIYDGRKLIAALAVGVDVSTMLGIVTEAPIRFFRPAAAGGFGALAAIANLGGFDAETTLNAMGIQYGQTSGTMQPHVEGVPLLGLQVGFNARAAIVSADLAQAGFIGPRDFLTGKHGYFELFEMGRCDVDSFLPTLGRSWQIEAMSHKPFASGRLTHGAIDAIRQLRASHDFTAEDIASIRCEVPPVVFNQVGRPDIARPEPNYAKLCLRYVLGALLTRDSVDVEDFRGTVLSDPAIHAVAAKVDVVLNDVEDANAFYPQRIAVTLKDGAVYRKDLDFAYGAPEYPLTPEENVAKFRRCLTHSAKPIPKAAADRVIDFITTLTDQADIAVLPLLTNPEAA
ncbi:MmgE/PrpD family protein (plasmid) [Sulfitobacter sp. LCG007]